MKNLIVTVGGAGQNVLHYYTQLYLTGAVELPFKALVIDADESVASLRFMSEFFPLAGVLAANEIPSIALERVQPANSAGEVRNSLGYYRAAEANSYEHPAQAFFCAESLGQQVANGLFGRPCLSAVMALQRTMESLERLRIEPGMTITVVCSCVGGTGAGLAIQVLDWLTRRAAAVGGGTSVRLVLLGQFFRIRDEAIQRQDSRSKSHRLLFAKMLEFSVPRLHSFAFIEDPIMDDRPKTESQAKNLPWPQPAEPYWRATNALDFLLHDRIREQKNIFEEKEVDLSSYAGRLDHPSAQTKRALGVARVGTFVEKEVFKRIFAEVIPHRTWGTDLTGFIRQVLRLMEAGGGKASDHRALGEVGQAEMRKLWAGGESYGLRMLFPPGDNSICGVGEISGAAWPTIQIDRLDAAKFLNVQSAGKMLAATVMFSLLRSGGK